MMMMMIILDIRGYITKKNHFIDTKDRIQS